MSIAVELPALGESVAEGTISRWLVKEGDRVDADQPQVGILRIGEIVKRPVVRTVEGEDAIVIRPIMHLALSYDHRVIDGAPANGFLHRVRQLLEEAEFDR